MESVKRRKYPVSDKRRIYPVSDKVLQVYIHRIEHSGKLRRHHYYNKDYYTLNESGFKINTDNFKFFKL